MGIKRGHQKCEKPSSPVANITEDEAALYDRQIRLWGVESQKRLRNCDILLIGLGGLGAEVAKNIVLAGVKSITLLDNKKIQQNDFASQFLLQNVEVGENRAEGSTEKLKQLNPNVAVMSETSNVCDLNNDYFKRFNVICATDCGLFDLLRLDEICRNHKIFFFCGDVWGFHGYCFEDLGHFTFLGKADQRNSDEPDAKKSREVLMNMKFGSLQRALSFKSGKAGVGLHKKISKVFFLVHLLIKFREVHNRSPLPQHQQEDLKSLQTLRKTVMMKLGFEESKISDEDLKKVFGELSPVCAIVGGVLSQEIIKGVGADQIPMQNFFLFDGDKSVGVVENIS